MDFNTTFSLDKYFSIPGTLPVENLARSIDLPPQLV
jgi:hypothetical protein